MKTKVLGPLAVLVSLGVLALPGCGAATSAQPSASTDNVTVPATPGPATLVCTSSGQASPSWPAPWTGSASAPAIVSAIVAQDTFKLTFDSGTPEFEVIPQPTSHFNFDSGLGQPIDLAGSAGVRIVLKGFRGDMNNYAGPVSITSHGPLLMQIHAIGEYEGQVTWAAGLSSPSCASVTAAGSVLSFRFIPSH